MNFIRQLATPSQMVPSLNDDVKFGFSSGQQNDKPKAGSFEQPKVGQSFIPFAPAQPNGAIIKANGDIVKFDQNKPWEKVGNGGNAARQMLPSSNED